MNVKEQNLTVNGLLDQAEKICKTLLEEKGYTTARLDFIALHKDSITYHIHAADDFQESLDYNDRYESGRIYFHEPDVDEELEEVPGRAKREFTVLRKRLAGVGQFSDMLVSLAGKAFFEEISTTLRKYDLIEDMRGHSPSNHEEIQF